MGPTISWQLYSRRFYILKICYMTFITRGEVEHPRSSPSVCKKRMLHGTRTTDSLVWHCMRPLLVKHNGSRLPPRVLVRRPGDLFSSLTGLRMSAPSPKDTRMRQPSGGNTHDPEFYT